MFRQCLTIHGTNRIAVVFAEKSLSVFWIRCVWLLVRPPPLHTTFHSFLRWSIGREWLSVISSPKHLSLSTTTSPRWFDRFAELSDDCDNFVWSYNRFREELIIRIVMAISFGFGYIQWYVLFDGKILKTLEKNWKFICIWGHLWGTSCDVGLFR